MTRIERRRRRKQQIIRRVVTVLCLLTLLAAVVLAMTAPCSGDSEPTTVPVYTVVANPLICPAPPAVREVDPSPAVVLAQMAWGEARGCSTTEQAAAMWCALNRVDSDLAYFPDSVVEVVAQEGRFHGYSPEHPVTPELLALAEDVLARREAERYCIGGVGRVLPEEYLYFSGDGEHNYFRTEYQGGVRWDWSLESPYKE